MKPEAKMLARAILTRIAEKGGSASKTKLLKLMYLADINQYRATGETLTGMDWIHFHFGPWSAEYDALLKSLADEDAVKLESWVGAGVEGERIQVTEPFDLNDLIKSAQAYYATMRAIDHWAAGPTSSLLDYVYFETEPMQDAPKRSQLDFSKVAKEFPALYKAKTSGRSEGELKALRRRAAELAELQRKKESTAPLYIDDALVDALAVLSAESE